MKILFLVFFARIKVQSKSELQIFKQLKIVDPEREL